MYLLVSVVWFCGGREEKMEMKVKNKNSKNKNRKSIQILKKTLEWGERLSVCFRSQLLILSYVFITASA